MPKPKQSFFQRLTGSVHVDDNFEDVYEEEPRTMRGQRAPEEYGRRASQNQPLSHRQTDEEWLGDVEEEGQLTVDVYQTEDDIVVRSIVAGVKPDDLDISISRDMVTVRGKREEEREVTDDAYFHRELYWGSFSRTVILPAEVEVEEAQAVEKYGVLTIRIPKVNKEKQKKVKVKAG